MEFFVLLATATLAGCLHAFDADHMVAVTAFVSRRPALASAASFGARWGLGHAVAILLAGGVLLATGARLPQRFDSAAELLVGLVLIGLGFWAWRSARRLHLHAAPAAGLEPEVHAHPIGGGQPHHHSHDHQGITLVGLLHGLAGTSAAVALVPVTLLGSIPAGLGYLAAFGVGVIMAMTLFAVCAAIAMRSAAEKSLHWGRWIARAVGTASVGVGVWWVVRAVG